MSWERKKGVKGTRAVDSAPTQVSHTWQLFWKVISSASSLLCTPNIGRGEFVEHVVRALVSLTWQLDLTNTSNVTAWKDTTFAGKMSVSTFCTAQILKTMWPSLLFDNGGKKMQEIFRPHLKAFVNYIVVSSVQNPTLVIWNLHTLDFFSSPLINQENLIRFKNVQAVGQLRNFQMDNYHIFQTNQWSWF